MVTVNIFLQGIYENVSCTVTKKIIQMYGSSFKMIIKKLILNNYYLRKEKEQ